MTKELRIVHDSAFNLKESAYKYKVTHKSSTQGYTMLFHNLEGIQHQLKETHYDALVEKLELTNNETMYFVFKQLQ